MAWATPSSVSTGDVLTASRWNQDVVANAVELAPFMAAWTSYTPTLGGGFSNGNATAAGWYLKVGKLVQFYGYVVFGSTTTKGAVMGMAFPVPAKRLDAGVQMWAVLKDVSGLYATAVCLDRSAAEFEIAAVKTDATYATIAQINATTPFTWATGDIINFGGVYEAA